uniref:(northern house mosquito) hypothetical protein n=1 Tax=Culex pipiens TaxID=7175 RepID=A0A8D8F2L9_CULPI
MTISAGRIPQSQVGFAGGNKAAVLQRRRRHPSTGHPCRSLWQLPSRLRGTWFHQLWPIPLNTLLPNMGRRTSRKLQSSAGRSEAVHGENLSTRSSAADDQQDVPGLACTFFRRQIPWRIDTTESVTQSRTDLVGPQDRPSSNHSTTLRCLLRTMRQKQRAVL